MKKRNIILIASLMLSLSACGGKDNSATTAATQTLPESTIESTTVSETKNISELEAIGEVKVEKELFDVIIDVPKDFVGETTQEELDKEAAKYDYKAVLNADGSATYTMTKSQHKKFMKEFADNLNKTLSEMVGSEDYPNFTNITANNDFTTFTVTTKSAELDLAESFSVIGFYMYGGIYNIYNGTPVDNIHVNFINADTGEIITSSDSKDMGEENK